MTAELASAISRHCVGSWSPTAVPRLTLVAVDGPIEPTDMMYRPMLCFVASGAKRTLSGDLTRLVEPGAMFLSTLEVPVTATFERVPYRSAVLLLEQDVLADLILEVGPADDGPLPDPRGLLGAPMTPQVAEAVTRWVRLLDTPGDIRALAGRMESELLYRLLGGPFGPVLRQFALADSRLTQIRAAAAYIRERFAEPLSTASIAGAATMSPATMHRHFRTATGMSPLQFQKTLRLQEARRLLLSGGTTAAVAAGAVGYASATQFNREYRRAYGIPPAADAARLRKALTV
jgi:AraC-like DNA-binding protein